jgi:hypothetical protein
MAMAAYSQPTAPRLPSPAAVSGNSARGMARTMATMSTANDSSSTGRVAMKASPSTTDRSPGAVAGPVGGSAGRRRAAYRATVKMARSVA